MSTKEKMYQELINQGLNPKWVDSYINVNGKLIVRFYPDGKIELLRYYICILGGGYWKSKAISKDIRTISLIAKAQFRSA